MSTREERWCGVSGNHDRHDWDWLPGPGIDPEHHVCPGQPMVVEMTSTVEQTLIDDRNAAEQELRAWWADRARKDADAVIPKAVEYSASDLDIMGNALLHWGGADWNGAPDEQRRALGQEQAIAFYVLGKVSRLIGAYGEGRLPSEDTWDDVRIYATMAARVRQTGRWGL